MMTTMAMMTTTATMAALTLNSLCRIGAYEPVKRVYVDNSGQTSGLGLMGCRIAAGITTGIILRIIMRMMVMMMVQDFLVDNDSNGIIDNDSNDIKDYDNFAAQAPWQSWWPSRLMWSRFVTDEN